MEMNEKRPDMHPIVDVDGFIADGKQFDLDITLANDRRNVIFGVVRDNFKEPVRDAVVKLVENPRMIIVDEIDYLINNTRAIETIRDLHDETGIPILLVGMGAVDKKLSRYKHFFDRIVEIYRFIPFNFEDVNKFLIIFIFSL